MKTVMDMVEAARARITNLDVAQLRDAMGDGAPTIVDIREPGEVAASGTIPGAIQVPRGLLEFKADATSPVHDQRLDATAETILYCASGGRSALAAAALAELGYDRVGHLDGGFAAWQDAGGPIVEG